jgi:hypothetical protein
LDSRKQAEISAGFFFRGGLMPGAEPAARSGGMGSAMAGDFQLNSRGGIL